MKNWKTFLVIGYIVVSLYVIYLMYQQLQAFENKVGEFGNAVENAVLNPFSTIWNWLTGNTQTPDPATTSATDQSQSAAAATFTSGIAGAAASF